MDAYDTDPTKSRDTVEQIEDQKLRNPITDDDTSLVTPGEGSPAGGEADPDEESEGPPNSPKASPL